MIDLYTHAHTRTHNLLLILIQFFSSSLAECIFKVWELFVQKLQPRMIDWDCFDTSFFSSEGDGPELSDALRLQKCTRHIVPEF